MFDGKAKLADADFAPVSTDKTAAFTGKGGQVTDLKTFEPATPKLSCTSEFCLAGKSNTLVASAKNAGSAQNTEAASVKTALSPQKAQAAKPKCDENSAFCPGQKPCPESKKCESTMGDGYWPNDCIRYAFCGVPDEGDEGGGCPAGQVSTGWWFFKKCVPACGGIKYNTNKECCVNGKILKKCGAECYDPKTTCCENGKTHPKCEEKCYKSDDSCCLENTVMSKHEIKNLYDCTERYRGPFSDWEIGCQVSNWWKISHFSSPDNPAGGKKTSFESVCTAHIRCYSTCANKAVKAKEKTVCDSEFQPKLNNICETNAATTQEQDLCLEYAKKYTKPTAPMMLQKFHDKSQMKQCTCCPKQGGGLPQ